VLARHGFGGNLRKLLSVKMIEDFSGQTAQPLPICAA